MSKKKHIDINELSSLRNQLNVKSLGDKNYKHPDYSKNFYQDGGLIPGSNVAQRKLKAFDIDS